MPDKTFGWKFNRDSGLQIIPQATTKVYLGDGVYDLAGMDVKQFAIYNRGIETTDAVLEYSPDGTNWGTYSDILSGVIGSGIFTALPVIVNAPWRYWRVGIAAATAPGTVQTFWNF